MCVTFVEVFRRKMLKALTRLTFLPFLSYQRQLEFFLLSISLQATLLKEDMMPYGTLNPQTTVV